ncbi:MAG: zinc ribbon domain-containing protein [Actinomycetota bacterium]|nr:zinc ribbon domain-containing protein [Actinomycetota bacterium]
MKHCELCGTENPDEARFCMKCGKDLDAVQISQIPEEMFESETFTPAGSEEAPIGGGLKKKIGPEPDEGTEAFRRPIEKPNFKEQIFSPEQDDSGVQEIQQTDVTADFAERMQYCNRCGMANPYDQKYCKNCGSELGEERINEVDSSTGTVSRKTFEDNVAEIRTLTDISQPSDYYATEGALPPRQKLHFEGGIAKWEVREWLLAILLTLIVFALLWFFVFGGKNMFSASTRNIKKCSSVMKKLSSYQLNVSGNLESEATGGSSASGTIIYEYPDKASSAIVLNIPGREPVRIEQLKVSKNSYALQSGSWQQADPSLINPDPNRMFQNFRGAEELGNENIGQLSCLHYRYRINTENVTGILGASKPEGASDALIEIWIDSTTFQLEKLSATVINVQIEGVKTRVSLLLELAATNQVYNLSAPL